ncbi:MAG: Ku protein [Janthinobacterium lividum]
MPRAIWKGAVSFGLVNVPVRLYAATGEHDIRFHQVHRSDGGRIRMRRTCSVDGEEVAYDEVAKGYESPDGKLVVLSDDDLAELPVASGHEIDVLQFVPVDQVDPMLLSKPYYLEPESRAAKPYALLREALVATERMAVVKVALRQRESIAVLRVREKVIVLQTMLWPDEVRAADFDVLDTEVDLRPQELQMASSLVESLAADFRPEQFEDDYSAAVKNLIDARLEDAEAAPSSVDDEEGGSPGQGGEVLDLLTALQRRVDRARGSSAPVPEDAGETPTTVQDTPPPTTNTATKSPAKKATAKRTTAKKTTAKTGPDGGTAAEETVADEPARRTTTRARKSA